MIELNKIYNMDCVEGMKLLPDESIDMVLTDPPYKLNHTSGSSTNSSFKEKWRGNIGTGSKELNFEISISFSSWLPEAYRVMKKGSHCYVFCNDKNLGELLQAAKGAGFSLSNILVWMKNNCTPNRYYMKNCEFIVLLYKKPARTINNMSSKACIPMNNINGRHKLHPTEKPVELLKIYIDNSSEKDGLVLDPFMGSGSTALACIDINRNYIGFELDPDYYKASLERLQNVQKQITFEELLG